jgi:hypothetical protein
VQQLHPDGLGGGGDQQVRVSDAALMRPALVGELAVDVDRTRPLPRRNRELRQFAHLQSALVELSTIASALQQL